MAPCEESRGEEAMTAARLLALSDQEQELATLDENHLGRMTLGDRRLEHEVLEIFARQNSLILKRIVSAEPGPVAAAAHTLKGSARGVGAWRVARAAERLEQAATQADEDAMKAALVELEAASFEVCAAIAVRLGAHPDKSGSEAFRYPARAF
jgi:HPt (histidine-containing phosphotransfer) domain-containing protein